MPAIASSSAVPHLLKLALAPDELGQPAPRRELEMVRSGPSPSHFVNVDRLADAFDLGRSQATQLEIAFAQLARVFADRDRADRRERLQPRGKIGGVADRRVLGLARRSATERTTTSPVLTPTRASSRQACPRRYVALCALSSSCISRAA